MKVKNMEGNAGQPVKNQFVVTQDDGTEYFQSYDSIIARKNPDGSVDIDVNMWNYSVTTGKYRNLFLGESKKETEKKIKNGIYILLDLN